MSGLLKRIPYMNCCGKILRFTFSACARCPFTVLINRIIISFFGRALSIAHPSNIP